MQSGSSRAKTYGEILEERAWIARAIALRMKHRLLGVADGTQIRLWHPKEGFICEISAFDEFAMRDYGRIEAALKERGIEV